jgi:hypothetical protein
MSGSYSVRHLCAGVCVALQEAGDQVQREAHRPGKARHHADQHQRIQHRQASRARDLRQLHPGRSKAGTMKGSFKPLKGWFLG